MIPNAVSRPSSPLANRLWAGAREGRGVLGTLERLDAGDVRQGAENEAVGFGIPDEQVGFQQDGNFGVPNFVSLAVRQTDLERGKRLYPQHALNRFDVHPIKCTTVDNE